jgi:hypothetical protein
MSLLKTGACFTNELKLTPNKVEIAKTFKDCSGAALVPDTMLATCADLPAPQVLSVSGDTLTLSGGGGSVTLPDTQDLSISGNVISLTNGGSVTLPTTAAPTPQVLSVSGDTLTLSGGGGSVTLPDTQDLSISGNVLSLTNGGSVTLPAATAPTLSVSGSNLSISGGNTVVLPAASVTFATPAETVAGTSTTLAVNPADLFARENIAAQTGVSNDLAAIPAPTAGQSNWAVNLLGETLHYEPGVGWKLVANAYYKPYQQTIFPSIPGGVTVTASDTVPRAGRLLLSLEVLNLDAYSGTSITALARIAGNPSTTRHGSRAVGAMLPVEGISSLTAYFTVAAGDILELIAYPTTAASGPIYTRYSYQYVD